MDCRGFSSWSLFTILQRVLSNIISFLGMFNPSGRVLSVSLHSTRNHWHWWCVYPGMAGVIFDTSVPNIFKTASDELTQYELYTLYRRNTRKKLVYILCWTSSVVFTGTFFFKDRAIYGSHTRQMSKIPNSWFLIPALNYYFLLRCCPLFPILASLTSLFTFFSTVDWYFRDRLYSPFRRGILISFTTAQKNDLENRLASGFTTSFNFTAHDSDPSFLRRSHMFKDALYLWDARSILINGTMCPA